MPFNGTGMFVRLRNWVADAAAGVKIRADYHDIEDDGFADGLSYCITKDGQTTILQNIPMNLKRITAMQDPVDVQDAATKAYADLKLPLAGGTITGDLNVTGKIGALGYRTRPGISGAQGANAFNFNWVASKLAVWVDSTNIGDLATQAYADSTASTYASNAAAPKVNRAGDTIAGNLQISGYLGLAPNILYFSSIGSAAYFQWAGGPNYVLGGGGTIWHSGSLNPIQDGRLVNVGGGVGTINPPAGGAVITALTVVASGTLTGCANGAFFRQLQLLTPGGWYAVGYVG